MKVTVKKWGNSASIRIPAPILEAANLALDDQVDIREENGQIIIEVVRHAPYDLDALVSGITTTNRHHEIDFGAAEGKETF